MYSQITEARIRDFAFLFCGATVGGVVGTAIGQGVPLWYALGVGIAAWTLLCLVIPGKVLQRLKAKIIDTVDHKAWENYKGTIDNECRQIFAYAEMMRAKVEGCNSNQLILTNIGTGVKITIEYGDPLVTVAKAYEKHQRERSDAEV